MLRSTAVIAMADTMDSLPLGPEGDFFEVERNGNNPLPSLIVDEE